MGVSTPNNMRRLKGRLVWKPTDLTAAYPYGGKQLGFCRSATFVWGIQYQPVHAEEFGGAVVENIYMSETAVLTAVLRDYDEDMVEAVFPNFASGTLDATGHKGTTSASTLSGNPVVKGHASAGATTKPGTPLASTRAQKLVFAPDDEDNHEFLMMYNVVPMVDQSAQMMLTASEWAEIGVVFQALPDSSGKLYQFGRKGDVSLT